MSQLLSTVFHEVRNPLGVINLHAELILKNPEKAAMSAEIISRTSKNLEKTLTELLELTKPIKINKVTGNLEQELAGLVEMFRLAYEDKNVEINFKNSLKEKAQAEYDRLKINQALINLLKNALEFSKPGDSVEVSLEKTENDFLIKISDEGPGIPPENREKIFEPFFTTRQQGTGIGLAQTKKIIEAHEGTLSIDTDKKQGTTFIIRLKGG